jgi:hypothetical protein
MLLRLHLGEKYVGQADNLLERLIKRGDHKHQTLINEPANKLTTYQINMSEWLARGGKAGKQAQDVFEEIMIRTLDSASDGLNERHEMNIEEFIRVATEIGAPKINKVLEH